MSLQVPNGDLPKLTKKERELYELLAENPGRCFSRGYLLKTIWGYSDDTRTRTVDVHVSRLRKKLEGRSNVAIHTVVRQGYVLEQRGETGGREPKLSAYDSSIGADSKRFAAYA